MRQAITTTTVIGGVLKQEYIGIFDNNHLQISLGSFPIYDGDEQRGWKWLEERIQRDKEIAENMGLSFERIG